MGTHRMEEMMQSINHRFVETNNIKMHIAEQGQGNLVILCHGFPECWYAWRHQISAIADAGFHVVAPDLRGYGQTDQPTSVEAYNILQLTSDIVRLVYALDHEQAMVIGHDQGAPLAWHCALLRPDLFRAIGLLSVPYRARAGDSKPPTEILKQMAGEQQLYVSYFQEQGVAEAELEADVRKSLRMMLYSASGEAPPEKRWRLSFDKSESFLDSLSEPEQLPNWFSDRDLDFLTCEFERTGFRGGLARYRNLDRDWELTAFLSAAKLQQPALFIGGEFDIAAAMNQDLINQLETTMPNLRKAVMLPKTGHWIQQERPTEVNRLLAEFLSQAVSERA
ncbi:alpha/beta fold hydrolase [Leptolyngbya sp. NIES-2104]|uniref:alpha/beta fold hydrolase n=1 Tax=Leptolyngbya sp. NIES-2104 TaxID=1552121 RepID=UPI0006ECBC57|nr:alpha/beta hydrolase [Leptolyngbya sp. NIES-2104]GAP99910.1 epoxide hydrolase [Leptolyngbya sp. NIES-2104]